jgi:hypothetical protein
MTVSSTARGIGIRALILVAGLVLLGIWLISAALHIAAALIKLLLWAGLILVVVGFVAVVMHRFRRRA